MTSVVLTPIDKRHDHREPRWLAQRMKDLMSGSLDTHTQFTHLTTRYCER